MNRLNVKFTHRIASALLLASICVSAFVWTRTAASEQVASNVPNQNLIAEARRNAVAAEPESSLHVASARAQGSGTLKRHGALSVPAGEGQAAAGSPRVALAADFDADGVNDLLVAHHGRLVLHRGNTNAFAPQTKAAWEAMRDGRFISPFERKTRAFDVPTAADFIFAGDFNRDARLDAAFAARGDSFLYLLEGDGVGGFTNLRRIETAGAVTSAASGDVNRADGLTDLLVGTRGADGFSLQIFSGLGDIFAAGPQSFSLPSQAEAIAVGQLNENEFADIAVGTDGEVIILSGTDTTRTGGESVTENLRLPLPAGVKSIVTGDLVPDRDSRTELAVLSPDGTVRILARGSLDTRPVGINEHLAEQVREYQAKGYPVPKRVLGKLSESDLRQPLPRRQSDVTTWAEAEIVTAAAPNSQLSAQSILTTGRISDGAADDLIVLDQSSNKVLVMPFELDYGGVDRKNTHLSFAGRRAVQDFEAAGPPVAALALKLNFDTDKDLLVLHEGGSPMSAFVSAPQATFTVTTAADDVDNNLGNGVCAGPSGCTLRAAIMEANRLAGDDVIMINAGINPTISRGQPDNDGQGTNDQATGDLDITCVISNPATGGCDLPILSNQNDLSIIGAAGGNTVTAGTFTPYPVNGGGTINTDRVFDVGQDGIFGGGFGGSTGVSAVFTNLTIQNGNVREALNTALGGGNRAFGGGIRYDGFGNAATHGSLTLNNSTINNNQSDNAGGGVYHVYGSHTATGTTFSNNITKAGEGGGLFFGAATSNSNVNISSSTFNANEARQGTVFGTFTANADGGGLRINADPNTVTIGTTNFTNNIAQQDGGAIKTLGALVTVTGGTMTGNTARRHGGVAFGDEDTANSPAFVTFSGSTMRNNTANSDNAIFAGDVGAGDGGAIFRDRGTLNITNCTVGGTGAGEPNTATNGGGVAHAFTVDSAAGNDSNQTIVTINGGSINGNVANTDGGGVYFNSQLFDTAAGTLNIGQTTATAFTGNKAKNNGGGVHVSNSATANLKDMTLRSNQANSDTSGGGDGGALYQNTGTTTFTGTLTIGGSGFANSAVNGGGIRNDAGTVTIPSGASVTHNTATGAGGGISNAGTLSALTTATITNNTAAGNGGGIHNTGTLGTITTPTINSNSAASGGGIFNSNGNLVVSNGSVSSNTGGGGIAHSGSASSSVTGVTINNNTGNGILITANSLDANNNTITNNSADGISKPTGAGTGSHFGNNTIHSNGGLGIDLGPDGVTANDANNDPDTGPNNLQNFPVINYVRRGNGTAGLANFTLNAANGSHRVQFYANAACDPSGHGEGEAFLASQTVTVAGNTVTAFSTAPLAYGAREQITATATHDANNNGNYDDDGNTSEFSACRKVNTLPTVTPQAGVTRQQGTPVSNSQIAAVADPDQTLNTLAVTIRAVGAAGAGTGTETVNGVTVSNLAVSAAGVVTANVVATCAATNANFTLRVTDNAIEFNEATLSVTVTPNTPPAVGTYPNTLVNAGTSGGVVTPSAAPTDNSSVVTLTAAAPGFTGTFVGNTTTGALTVNSAGPAGVYTVTVTATDDCGATTTTTFQLTVNAIPTIAAQAGVTRQQGSGVTNSQIASVNDADQPEETLAVKIRAVGGVAPGTGTETVNGVTVSNLAVSAAGVVTADVVASCTATNAAFTLRVTDANGAFTEATLNVAATANTAPTAGTYPDASTTPGGGATVTPGTVPADNGSIATAAATAPGFTGTLSVSTTTGVVTVANANPAGNFTVTVTFTDDCGATTTRTFDLEVIAPPDVSIRDGSSNEPAAGSKNMTFTVVLSVPAGAGGVTVDFTTADEPAGVGKAAAGADYTTTSDTLTFAAGQQVQTVSVPVLADGTAGEPDETFLVTLSAPANANIVDGQATGTITAANPPGTILISELRTSGPGTTGTGDAGDEFVEVYNNSDAPVTVPGDGWGLFKMGATCTDTPVLLATIAATTVIPGRGHFLFGGSGYSLAGAASLNLPLGPGIEADRNVGLFSTAVVANLSAATRLDAVGFGANVGNNCDLLSEGTTLAPAQGSISQHTFVRNQTTGTPLDRNDNASDFLVLSTTPATPVGATGAPRLGAPGPENQVSPVNRSANIKASFFDPQGSPTGGQNRVRVLTPDAPNNSTFGTLAIRRKFTNATGGPVTRLRFRVIDITTCTIPPCTPGASAPPGVADLRVRTSPTTNNVPLTGGGTATAQGLTLEQPPAQPNGGGWNSTVAAGTITTGAALAAGASINVEFLLGVQQTGTFRFFVIVEAAPGGPPFVRDDLAPDQKALGGRGDSKGAPRN